MQKQNKGFTLMEMLIVVAIIAVMVGIGIPTMMNAREKSREARDMAALRVAYSKLSTALAEDNFTDEDIIYDGPYYQIEVPAEQTLDNWTLYNKDEKTKLNGCEVDASKIEAEISGWNVRYDTNAQSFSIEIINKSK